MNDSTAEVGRFLGDDCFGAVITTLGTFVVRDPLFPARWEGSRPSSPPGDSPSITELYGGMSVLMLPAYKGLQRLVLSSSGIVGGDVLMLLYGTVRKREMNSSHVY